MLTRTILSLPSQRVYQNNVIVTNPKPVEYPKFTKIPFTDIYLFESTPLKPCVKIANLFLCVFELLYFPLKRRRKSIVNSLFLNKVAGLRQFYVYRFSFDNRQFWYFIVNCTMYGNGASTSAYYLILVSSTVQFDKYQHQYQYQHYDII